MAELKKFIGHTILWLYSVVVNGFVASKLWGWFLTPVFDITPPSIIHCYGIMYFLTYITGSTSIMIHLSTPDIDHDKLVKILFTPWLLLMFGWVINILAQWT